jgi:N6-adenosine-specific RNA methylase IME4
MADRIENLPVKLDRLRSAIRSAKDVPELQEIRAKALAIEHYMRLTAEPLKVEHRELQVLLLRIQRRLGEMLKETVRPGGDPMSCRTTLLPKGITRDQSSKWQRLANMDTQKFEHYLASTSLPTLNGVLREAIESEARSGINMTATCTGEDFETLIPTGIKFRTIYADPPWAYGNQGTRAATGNHYVTMVPAEIAALPVEKIVADVAQLHLWTTNAFLRDSFNIIEAWGFTYKSILVWIKPTIGIGNYWRVSHEFLLLGTRGSAMFPMEANPDNLGKKRVPDERHSRNSWVQASRTEHSMKPHIVREMVEDVSHPPRLEMFGRQTYDHWVVWGNEITRSLFHQRIKDLAE